MGAPLRIKQIHQEAARVAAAFDLSRWGRPYRQSKRFFKGMVGETLVVWSIKMTTRTWKMLTVQRGDYELGEVSQAIVKQEPDGTWSIFASQDMKEFLARGLYRLGFEDKDVWSELPQLSAHEKLELRLSMPREFWHHTWLEEEQVQL